MRILIVSFTLFFIVCSGGISYAAGLKSSPEFLSLEKAFPKSLSVADGEVTVVEFCPDNTCYAFKASRGVSDEELAGFIYLYLFYSSDYVATEVWQNNPENAAMAVRISAKMGPASCRSVSGAKAGLCVLNSFMEGNKVKVSDVRYDENERLATPVKKAALARTGQAGACRDFTEAFLKWYVPLALRDSKDPAAILALRRKPEIFSEKVRKSLEEDRKAQEKSNDIVGIDFDPFLSAQDPAEKYLVGKVTVEDGKCLADIKSVAAVQRDWDVRAEAKQPDGNWRFTNFHYNTDVMPNDLLSKLRDLKLARSTR
jgi:hypothetical protein